PTIDLVHTTGYRQYLDSFPTRRSSDLRPARTAPAHPETHHSPRRNRHRDPRDGEADRQPQRPGGDPAHRSAARREVPRPHRRLRSEEHTSELQSRENLVCRLLLENKIY